MPDRVISVPQATQIAQRIKNKFDNVNGRLDSILVSHAPVNYFDFTQEAIVYKAVDDLAVTYDENNIGITFTSTANPILIFKVDGLISGKKYKVNFAVTNGQINETYSVIRKYYAADPKSGAQLAAISFVGHVGTAEFTVPSGATVACVALMLKYNSKNVTITGMEVVAVEDKKTTYIRQSAENPNNVYASFIYGANTGDCTILKIKGDESDKVVMIDAMGNESTAKASIIAALSRGDISHIDYFILSHWHNDHYGCIEYLHENGYIDSDTVFYLPEDPDGTSAGLIREDNPDNVVVQRSIDILAIIAEWGCSTIYPNEGDVLAVNDCDFVFWNCDHTEYYARAWVDYNECSLCCTMIYGNTVIHFTGDIGPVACGKYYDKLYKCNIYKSNHHSCGYAVVPKFMSAVCPEIVIAMAGSNVVYSTKSNVQAVFASLTTGVQQWCEDEYVPAYITGVLRSNIYMTIGKNGYKFDSYVRRCVRADEGIPVE